MCFPDLQHIPGTGREDEPGPRWLYTTRRHPVYIRRCYDPHPSTNHGPSGLSITGKVWPEAQPLTENWSEHLNY